MITRRHLLTNAAGFATAATIASPRPASSQPAAPNLGPNRLVFLGTRGGPAIRSGYTPAPSSSRLVVDNVPYVIDTGYGVSFKLR